MHPNVAKLVEAGRIPKPVGERLSQLAPGNFCIHKSFGAGKVIDWDLPGKKVVIDFEKSTGQAMELQFAFQKTEWIPGDDFRAKKIEQLEELRSLSKSDPIALIVHLLESHGGSMTGDALEKQLCGAVIPEPNFKKWWDNAKKALRESRLAVVPQKRTEAIVLRTGDRSPAEALVADFEAARDIKGMIKALEAIAADIGAFDSDTDALKRLLNDIDEGAKKAARVQLGQALQLVAARDEVIGSSKALELDPGAVKLADLLKSVDAVKLADDAGALPSARQRAVYEAFPEAFGERWVEKIMRVFDKVGARGVTEIARILLDRNELPALVGHLRSAIARRALGTDALIWVCRERKSAAVEVFSADVGASVLNLLENDHLSDGPRTTSRLQSLLGDDKALLTDLVGIMDVNEARNFSRRLLDCPVFGDLEKKSLMARIIKARPETAELVSGGNQRREETLLVSWESLEKKKAELDDIIRNPTNIHPTNKSEVARRLALWALADTYGKKDIVKSGPLFSGYKVTDKGIAIRFEHTGGGLTTRDGTPPDWFEIAGADAVYQKADAKISDDGKWLLLTSAAVPKPDRARFAWSQIAEPNLMNKEGLPAAAFNTHWPSDPTLGTKVSGGKSHQSSHPNTHGWTGGITDGTWGSAAENCYATDESPGFPKTVTVDLGSARNLHAVLYGTPEIGATKTVAVSISEDGQTFSEVGRTDFSPKQAGRAEARFEPRKARFVRATFLGNHPKQDVYAETFGFLSELEAYEP